MAVGLCLTLNAEQSSASTRIKRSGLDSAREPSATPFAKDWDWTKLWVIEAPTGGFNRAVPAISADLPKNRRM